MKLLIVAATWNEIKPLEEYLLRNDEEKRFREHAIELLVTGAGSTFTAFHLGKMLPVDNWDLAINLGICGSFNKEFPIGTTVNVSADTFGDLGAEDDEKFLDAFELNLLDADAFPFKKGWIYNQEHSKYQAIRSLPGVKGITVNTVSGNEKHIKRLISKFNPDVESMEGASFMYCCMKESIPFLQLRAVSNYVQKRDKTTWNIPLAIKNINDTGIKLLEEVLIDTEKLNTSTPT